MEQLSPENETLERRNLKSILKKLSASSRAGSSETSATSTPDREAAAELRRLMRAPTIEGYAARHSKLSKSVTFNKYTLQSPPSEQPLQPLSNYPLSGTQDQPSLPPPNKFSFRPVSSAGGVLQTVSRPREEECLGDLLSGVGEVIKAGLVSEECARARDCLLCPRFQCTSFVYRSLSSRESAFVKGLSLEMPRQHSQYRYLLTVQIIGGNKFTRSFSLSLSVTGNLFFTLNCFKSMIIFSSVIDQRATVFVFRQFRVFKPVTVPSVVSQSLELGYSSTHRRQMYIHQAHQLSNSVRRSSPLPCDTRRLFRLIIPPLLTLQEDMQSKFVRQFTSLELEVRKRDEIISQLQSRIQQLERRKLRHADDSGGDSTEHDASMEEDLDDDREDHPFMRDSSVDTVLGSTRSRDRHSSSSVGSSSRSRRSWEEHSERETLELQELPNSIVPQRLSREDVAIDLESNSDSRSDEEFDICSHRKGDSDEGDEEDEEEEEEEEEDDEDDDDKIMRQDGYNNWEVALLAKQLEARRRSGDNASPGS